MIKIIFKDNTSKRYSIGCKQLGYSNWDNMDYLPMYKPIAKIINVDVNTIKDWRVI